LRSQKVILHSTTNLIWLVPMVVDDEPEGQDRNEDSKGQDRNEDPKGQDRNDEPEHLNEDPEDQDRNEEPEILNLPYRRIDLVKELWTKGRKHEVLNVINGIQLTRKDFLTLRRNEWFNDKVIDAYMHLIKQRSLENSDLPKVYPFSTYFFTALDSNGYTRVSRWTSTVDIFSFDILLVPINLDDHWTLIAFDVKKNRISYFDSMMCNEDENSMEKTHIDGFVEYLENESMSRRGIPFDASNVVIYDFTKRPSQENEYDCGAFICCYAENITRRPYFNQFDFKQVDIRSLRRLICYELGTGQLLQ